MQRRHRNIPSPPLASKAPHNGLPSWMFSPCGHATLDQVGGTDEVWVVEGSRRPSTLEGQHTSAPTR